MNDFLKHAGALAIFCLLANAPLVTSAHSGHEHRPDVAQAPQGGQMKDLKNMHMELLVQGTVIKIYAYNKDMSPLDPGKISAKATVTLPKKKPEPLALAVEADHWKGVFDPKNTHRYTVEISVLEDGSDDKARWVVEPRKK